MRLPIWSSSCSRQVNWTELFPSGCFGFVFVKSCRIFSSECYLYSVHSESNSAPSTATTTDSTSRSERPGSMFLMARLLTTNFACSANNNNSTDSLPCTEINFFFFSVSHKTLEIEFSALCDFETCDQGCARMKDPIEDFLRCSAMNKSAFRIPENGEVLMHHLRVRSKG